MSIADGNYNGELYVGHVKWSNDYKHVVGFRDSDGNFSAQARTDFLKSHLTKTDKPIIGIKSLNSYIDVDGNLKGLESVNYALIKNDNDFSNTYFCCFVTDFQIIAKKTTRLFIQLDVFQQYFYSCTFYRSFIERGHISKAEDNSNYYKYVTPEPIGFNAEIETDKNIFSDIDFTPKPVFDSISEPTPGTSSTEGILVNYKYGGYGNGANSTGSYRWTISGNDSSLFNVLISTFQYNSVANTTLNHYSDIIGMSFLPDWVMQASTWAISPMDPSGTFLVLGNNSIKTVSDTVSVGGGTLGNGYTPTNKKMLNSLARAYKIYNRNGLSIPLNPDLLANRGSITISLSMRPCGVNYKLTISGYKDVTTRYIDLSYAYSIMFGINSNTGTAQQTALQQLNNQGAVLKQEQINAGITTAQNTVNSVVGGISGIVAGASAGDTSAIISGGLSIANAGVNAYKDTALQDVQNRANNFNQAVAVGNALSSITKSIGNNSDRTNMTADFQRIRLAECNPTLENCAIIDDFLTAYGYRIDEIVNIDNWLNTRPVFNFIKTNGINLNAQAPARYEQILKGIFDAGVTIWKNYNQFGNYSINNW